MNTNCYTGTSIQPLESEPCDGNYTSTNCVINPTIISYLELPANSTLTQIITNIVLSLQAKDEQIANLQEQINNL